MLDAKSLIYNHPNNKHLLKTLKKDYPIAAQLLGTDPCVMLDAAEKLLSFIEISFLDINSACPVKKIIKTWKLLRITKYLLTMQVKLNCRTLDEATAKLIEGGLK